MVKSNTNIRIKLKPIFGGTNLEKLNNKEGFIDAYIVVKEQLYCVVVLENFEIHKVKHDHLKVIP